MNILDILRAKSKDEKNYLLKDHIKETILRACQLREFINKNSGAINNYIFNDNFFKNLIVACFLHDLGKIDWKFQLSVYSPQEKEYDKKAKKYKSEDLNILNSFFKNLKIDVEHEIISLIFSLIFLENEDWDAKIRTTILQHHYNQFYTEREINICHILSDFPDLEKYIIFLLDNRDKIVELLNNLADYLLENTSCNIAKEQIERLKKNINFERIERLKEAIENGIDLSNKLKLFDVTIVNEKDSYEFFLFLGCLRRCDYSASGNVDIENAIDLKEKVYKSIDEKIKSNIKDSKLWQQEVIRKTEADNLVLIAPTGSGKTEFALLWAEKKGKKLIYSLPIRTALNDLYWRFCGNFSDRYFEDDFVGLLHSTSFIEFLKCQQDKEISIEEKINLSHIFSFPILLSTPDQVFLSCLKYYGFDKLFSIYPLSTIVVDEIQTYNPEMAAIIIKTVEIIKQLSGNLLVMTATFPPYFEKFVKEMGFSIFDVSQLNDSEKKDVKNYYLKRHMYTLLEEPLFTYEPQDENPFGIEENGFKKIKEIIEENIEKNILIIVNNVNKAIMLYRKLKTLFPEKERNLYLLHSRLLEKEKDYRINDEQHGIKKRLERNEKRIILISTQIVEASVDIDFDVLITEISPIDSQIQRWGRIFRNRNADYSDNKPNIFIFTEINKGTVAVYDKRVIEKTILVLKKYTNKFLDYESERQIIKEVFDEKTEGGKTLKDIFIDEISKNLEWLKYYSLEKRSEAQKLFRKIAGVQVTVLDFLCNSSDEIEKAFGEVIQNKNNWQKTWNEIISEVKERLHTDKLKQEVTKMHLLKILYLYSFNLPIFSFKDNIYQYILEEDFKGFFVLRTKNIRLEEIKEYGIDRLNFVDLDLTEIKESENII